MLDSVLNDHLLGSANAAGRSYWRARVSDAVAYNDDSPFVTATPQPAPRSARLIRLPVSNRAAANLVGTPSSSITSSDYLPAADLSRYVAIFERLNELERDEGQSGDFEVAAIESARAVLGGLVFAKWSPPRVTWQDGDAVVLYWASGDTVFAFTVTDGEFGFVERRGNTISKRGSSISVTDPHCFDALI